MPRLGALLLLLPMGCLAAPAPVTCPAGTQPESRQMKREPLNIEVCRDPRSRLREGPMRVVRLDGTMEASGQYRAGKLHGDYFIYGNDGVAALRIRYVDGAKLDEKLTPHGLRRQIEQVNLDWEKGGKTKRISVVDDRSVRLTVTIGPPYSWVPMDDTDAPVLRKRLLEDGRMCRMFSIPADIERIDVRYVNTTGKELTHLEILRVDCAPAGS